MHNVSALPKGLEFGQSMIMLMMVQVWAVSLTLLWQARVVHMKVAHKVM